MKVNPDRPFKIIYALYEHQYVGFLFESFAVQLNDHGKLTLTHQNISSKNAGRVFLQNKNIICCGLKTRLRLETCTFEVVLRKCEDENDAD